MENVLIDIKKSKRVVVKVGTSTLTYDNGRLNLRRIEKLCRVLSDLRGSGKDIILVSSGAIGAGVGRLGLKKRPTVTREKQAAAAVGQCELMNIYSRLFGEYGQNVAQILITKDVLDDSHKKQNAQNTFETLLTWGVIPIVNENDTISIDELRPSVFGENDSLSAHVAKLVQADSLVMLSDIDGLYDANPAEDLNAKLIHYVTDITDEIYAFAGGSGTQRGTGGMVTKLDAAKVACAAGVNMVITNGENPGILYEIFEGHHRGTVFIKK